MSAAVAAPALLRRGFITCANNASNLHHRRTRTHLTSSSSKSHMPVRYLNLHEYQSKGLMSKYNVRVQKGMTAATPEEAEKVAERLLREGAKELVIKAQVHAGGRGKGHFTNGFKGGVKISTE